jgi:NIPSNAP
MDIGRSGGRGIGSLLMVAALAAGVPGLAVAAPSDSPAVVHQLRIYEIFEGNKRQFHERFRDHAMRIMARYDFEIVSMWEAKGEDGPEFVYLLKWPDEATMKDRWENFMADEEWAEIKRVTGAKHGDLVGEIEDRTLRLTEYSPKGAAER